MTSASLTRLMPMPNSVDEQLGSVLVDRLSERYWHAHLEQRLHEVRPTALGHSVREILDRDRLRNHHVSDLLLRRAHLYVMALFLLRHGEARRVTGRSYTSSSESARLTVSLPRWRWCRRGRRLGRGGSDSEPQAHQQPGRRAERSSSSASWWFRLGRATTARRASSSARWRNSRSRSPRPCRISSARRRSSSAGIFKSALFADGARFLEGSEASSSASRRSFC